MDFIHNLLFTPSITQSLFVLTLTIAAGIFLADKLKIKSFSLGVTWILFMGILLSHFGMRLEPHVESFAKDFGLIMFVYSIGLQVGPSFFSSFGKGGLKLNMLAATIVLLSVLTTFCIHWITGTDIATMVGVLSGAVTNTPGLGAAQQAWFDMFGTPNPDIATGYAVAYPLGVVGIIVSIMLIRAIFRINLKKEEERLHQPGEEASQTVTWDIQIKNPKLDSETIMDIQKRLGIQMVVSRVIREDGVEEVANSDSIIHLGDTIRVITEKDKAPILNLVGDLTTVEMPKHKNVKGLVSQRLVMTKEQLNGKKIGSLNIRSTYNVNITRVSRAGVDLLATPDLVLQLGDRIMVVGDKQDVARVANIFGNAPSRLDIPNLLPIFFGIALGVICGTLPISIPGLSQPFKLGLAGGSLIVAILIGRFGPYYHMVTFTTTSANKMLRELGISLFLAAVGLGAGESFIPTIMDGGYWWILYGVIITMTPLLLVGTFARLVMKTDYFTLMGLIAGSTTDPPALAYAGATSPNNDQASVAYATVYPLTMFLRVMCGQLIILLCC